MNKLLISLLSAAALAMPLTTLAQAPAVPAAPVAQPDQAAPSVTNTDNAATKKAAKKAKKKKLKKKKSKKTKAHYAKRLELQKKALAAFAQALFSCLSREHALNAGHSPQPRQQTPLLPANG